MTRQLSGRLRGQVAMAARAHPLPTNDHRKLRFSGWNDRAPALHKKLHAVSEVGRFRPPRRTIRARLYGCTSFVPEQFSSLPPIQPNDNVPSPTAFPFLLVALPPRRRN